MKTRSQAAKEKKEEKDDEEPPPQEEGLDSWEDAEGVEEALARLTIASSAAVKQKKKKTKEDEDKQIKATPSSSSQQKQRTPASVTVPSLTPSEIEQSPVLSRYGVNLMDMRGCVNLPPDDVIAHALYLSGFPSLSSLTLNEKHMLIAPWSDAGAIISWLPDGQSAVATFCSIPTANRALRQINRDQGPIKAQSLKECSKAIQQQAKAAGLIIPPMPKADVGVSSCLIRGALGLRASSSSSSSTGSVSSQQRQTRSSKKKDEQKDTGGGGGGGGGDAWDA